MHLRTIRTCLTAALLLLSPAWSAAQDPGPKKPAPKASTPKAAAPKSTGAAAEGARRTEGKLKPVDINSAAKNELSFMLGISDALAAKIVAGRPYRTKAHLLTHGIVTEEVYARIKDKVMAKQ